MGCVNPVSIIACVVGIVGCVIGVATFISAQIVRAKEDGRLMEQIKELPPYPPIKIQKGEEKNGTED